MIVFDLSCSGNHRFEAWFRSSDDFDNQIDRALISCPHCGSVDVMKAPMAPAVPTKSNQVSTSNATPHKPIDSLTAGVRGGSIPPQVRKALGKIAEAQAKALEDSTWVGKDFAETSREMHYGEKDSAIIHGEATAKEAQALFDEGIAVAPLLFPAGSPDEVN